MGKSSEINFEGGESGGKVDKKVVENRGRKCWEKEAISSKK